MRKIIIHIIDVVLYATAYYYVFLSSINDGFSGFLLGVPFGAFLWIEIFRTKSKVRILHALVLILSLGLIVYDRSDSSLFYPAVGSSIKIESPVNYVLRDSKVEHVDFDPENKFYENIREQYYFKSGTSINILNQVLTGNPDFGTWYDHEIEADLNADGKLETYSINHLELSDLFNSQDLAYRKQRFDNYWIYMSFYLLVYPVVFIIFGLLVIVRNLGKT